MSRSEDWLKRLWAVLWDAREQPFAYGRCVLLAAECVDAVGGTSFLPEVEKLVAEHKEITLEALEAFVTERLGSPLATIRQACQGDVVLLNLPSGPALGICVGHQVACAGYAQGGRGVVYLKLEHALKAWRTP